MAQDHGNLKRIEELDYLKCIFIILMVIFHLVFIGDKYPYAKKIVYTFHMPAFLIISGDLVNVRKSPGKFFRNMLWIFIPYAVMEIGYVIMSSVLPVREKVTELSGQLLLSKTFLSPMGPYWYLHTLLICSIIYYLVYNYVKLSGISRFILLGLIFFVLSYGTSILSFANAIYFLAGIFICQSNFSFISSFQPSALAAIPFIILCCFPENLDRSTLTGVTITYLSISILLFIYPYLPVQITKIHHFIGRNTLVILLFSPVFTLLSKKFLPFFSFEPTGVCFMIVAVAFTIAGCIGIGWLTDRLNISQYCFGKKRILS